MPKVTGIRFPRKGRRSQPERRLVSSDNLRAAPAWITPEMVGQIVSLAMPAERKTVPVVTVPTRGVKPALTIVKEASNPPVTHSRRAEEDEAELTAPRAASPRRHTPKPRSTVAVASAEPPAARHAAITAAETGTAPSPGSAVPAREPICEAEKAAVCRPVPPAPSREPAPPTPLEARAHPDSERMKIDRASRRRGDAANRRNFERAADVLDSGRAITKDLGVHVVMAARALEWQRAQQERLRCPVEQAKTVLRRRYAPVCSMAVYDGDPELFVVGHRKNVTREELFALAERAAA